MKLKFLAAVLATAGMLASVPGAGAAERVVAIRAGKLVDVVAGKVLADQTILVSGERIVAVGPSANVAVPAGAERIDLSGATVLPGLVDAHVHLTGDPNLHGYKSLGVSDIRAAMYGVHAARLTLEAGFTTVRNVGAGGFGDVALRDAIDEGEVQGPRMRVAGYAIGIRGGHCDNNLLPADYHYTENGVADGPWQARAKVREMAKYGADTIKICASGGVLSKGDEAGAQQLTLEEMQAIVEEAHKLGRRVAAHAHGASSIRDAILAGVDSVEHGSLIDDEGIRLAREKGTYLVMDIYNDDYILQEGAKAGMLPESLEKEKMVGRVQRENFQKAFRAGVKMAFGTDAGVYPHGDNARQFYYMVKLEDTMMQDQMKACIDACYACATACDHCAASCLQEEDIKMMAGCIAHDMDCAQICRTAAAFMARGSDFARQLCRLCADVCTACAEECGKHPMDHCQACAQACRDCADACRRMADAA